jgi:dipeptidyl aminopeptidase/acylaminoacyl peptidase
MATGQRAFRGESAAETMAAILAAEPPDPSGSGRTVPPEISRIVRRCLEKDREARFQAARDIAFDLEDAITASGASPAPSPGRLGLGHRRWWLAAAAVVAAGTAGFLGGRRSGVTPAASRPSATFRQLTDLPGAETSPRLSPDGRTLLFVSRAAGNADIYVQRVGGHNPINITRDCLQDDSAPSFSPDGERIAFRSECDGGGIFVMGATGESRNRVTDFGHDPAWSPDGRKLAVATEQTLNPLNRIVVPSVIWILDVGTGEKRQLTSGDGMRPTWSPHGRTIAYWGLRGRSGQRDVFTNLRRAWSNARGGDERRPPRLGSGLGARRTPPLLPERPWRGHERLAGGR